MAHEYRQGSPVLKDVDFVFEGPGLLAIVGASGSGKTTLLGIIGGILSPTCGSVTFGGREPSSVQTMWVFQTPNVLRHRTALDNAALGGIAGGERWAAARGRAREILDGYGLDHVTARAARTLSGGEVQRLVLARAELAHASLVLADEPTGQLDRTNTVMVAEALRRLADSGATVVVATHDEAVFGGADARLEIVDAKGTYVAAA